MIIKSKVVQAYNSDLLIVRKDNRKEGMFFVPFEKYFYNSKEIRKVYVDKTQHLVSLIDTEDKIIITVEIGEETDLKGFDSRDIWDWLLENDDIQRKAR